MSRRIKPIVAGVLNGQLRIRNQARRDGLAKTQRAERARLPARNDLLPELKLVERSAGGLQPPSRNVRKIEPGHIREVANAISAFGFTMPILIDDSGLVLDGWIRVLAARELGLDRVPCILAGHLTPAEKRLLRIAVNRLGETGRWDLEELRIELSALVVESAPVEIAGFSHAELDMLMSEEEAEGVEKGPLEPNPEAEPTARPGDIFELGAHRVACGDCRDIDLLAQLMGENDVRIVLTDVPYNVPIRGHVSGGAHREFAMARGEMTPEQFLAFNRAWISAAGAYLVDGGILGSFIDWRGFPTIHEAATGLGLDPLNVVVWSKPNAGMGSLYRSAHELLPLFKRGEAAHVNNVELGRHGRWRSNVWVFPGASSFGSDARAGLKAHPTVKPTAMLEDALLDLTHRGEIVLDPFLGSGSTLIAADKAGRICRGVEIDPLYVDLILRRYEKATGRTPTRIVP